MIKKKFCQRLIAALTKTLGVHHGYFWRRDQAIPCVLGHRVVYKQLVKSKLFINKLTW